MVTLHTSVSEVIDREPVDVWQYVSDVTNQDDWVDGMSHSEVVGGGAVRRGSQIRAVYTMGGSETDVTMTITELREGRAVAFESSDGTFPFSGRLQLERQGGATRVTNAITVGSDHIVTSLMFTLLRPLTKMFMTRQLRKELGQLKTNLELSGDAG